MKSMYLKEYDALVSYFDLGESDDILVYLPGLNTPAMPLFGEMVYHPLLNAYRSLLIDYIGCGMSDYASSFDYGMETHADVVIKILEKEKISRCIIFGHSMGGTIGVYIAIKRPDLVKKLILAESNLSPGGGIGTKWITSFTENDWITNEYPNYLLKQRKRAIEGDALGALTRASWRNADPRGLYLSAFSLVNLPDDFKRKFYNLTIPRFFIYGENNVPNETIEVTPDTPDPKELSKNGVIPLIVPHSGHIMQIDNLNGFIEILHRCLVWETSNTG